MTTALSSEPPRARPASRMRSTSSRKPKVRAALSSCLKVAGQGDNVSSWRRMALEAKSIAKLTENRSSGSSTADLPGAPTETGLSTRINRPGELNHRVVDLEAGESRHQMFDRTDRNALAVAQGRAQRRIDGIAPVGREFGVEIAAIEADARVGRGRTQHHFDVRARMKADAPTMNRRPERLLPTGNLHHSPGNSLTDNG